MARDVSQCFMFKLLFGEVRENTDRTSKIFLGLSRATDLLQDT